MIKTLNYTGRRRISRASVSVLVDRNGDTPQVLAEWLIDDLALPASAPVVIEATSGLKLMRWEAGTVADRRARDVLQLSEFSADDPIRFRLKVLGEGERAGLILGEVEHIVAQDPDSVREAMSFLAVQAADLGDVAWDLLLADRPVLRVNEKVGDWKGFVRSEPFRALVLPEVFRRLLIAAVEATDADDEDTEQESWEAMCVLMAENMPGTGPRPDDDEEVWIESAVRSFARQATVGRWLRDWRGGSDE